MHTRIAATTCAEKHGIIVILRVTLLQVEVHLQLLEHIRVLCAMEPCLQYVVLTLLLVTLRWGGSGGLCSTCGSEYVSAGLGIPKGVVLHVNKKVIPNEK